MRETERENTRTVRRKTPPPVGRGWSPGTSTPIGGTWVKGESLEPTGTVQLVTEGAVPECVRSLFSLVLPAAPCDRVAGRCWGPLGRVGRGRGTAPPVAPQAEGQEVGRWQMPTGEAKPRWRGKPRSPLVGRAGVTRSPHAAQSRWEVVGGLEAQRPGLEAQLTQMSSHTQDARGQLRQQGHGAWPAELAKAVKREPLLTTRGWAGQAAGALVALVLACRGGPLVIPKRRVLWAPVDGQPAQAAGPR